MSLAFAFRRFALAAAFASVAVGASAGVSVRFSSSDPTATPFPSDRFTVREWHNSTFRRVNLPLPADCTSTPAKATECADLAVVNELDGFSTQPRVTVPFTGAIDPASVSSDTVYFVNLGDTLTLRGFGQRVGINQVVWDPASNTLVLQPDDLLQQHSRYVLIVTNGVRDTEGNRIESGRFDHDNKHGHHEYDRDLRDGVRGFHRDRVVAASLFTTQSITADLHKIVHQIKRSKPAPVNFVIGNGNTTRTVFALSEVAGIRFNRQNSTTLPPTSGFLPTPALNVVPGSVGRIAYGRYTSPDYEAPGKYIPPTTTLTGQPAPQGSNEIVFQLFVPAGARPAGGWPVAIFGHGFTDSMYGVPWTQASVYASQGIATISINVVGHGGGAAGTLDVLRTAGLPPVSLPAGGRGIDQDGNGNIDSTEGVSAAVPRDIIGSRDGLRQTVVDLMQLVRQIEAGVDIDNDGTFDLDANRIYYAGQSFGGIYGTIVLGVEPNIKAGVVNVPGGSITEIARLSPSFRVLTTLALATRGLLNLPPLPNVPLPFNLRFDENIPFRDQPTLVNTVPGALPIQQTLDRFQWVQQAGNPVSYAQHIRKQPLWGHGAKPVLVQFAKGDQTVPNPTSSALVRAGALEDRTVYFRNDLAWGSNNTFPKNPHTFLSNIGSAAGAPVAVSAQTQIAAFFASNGVTVIDPDGAAGELFEVPISGALPEALNFIP
jgi:hypothetical protein